MGAMILWVVMGGGGRAAWAQDDNGFGSARLISGNPEFSEDCFAEGSSCEDSFLRFLSESMLEQGFTMQNQSMSLSPLAHRLSADATATGAGVVGGDLSTFPLGPEPENLSGKTENTSYSPVFPRLHGGWLAPGGRAALGGFFLPPIPVNGASALALGLEGGVRFSPPDQSGWGLEGDLSVVRARAAIVASEEQLEERESFDNPDNIDPDTYASRCSGEDGCIDTYTLTNLGLRAGYGWSRGGDWAPYAKGGLTLVRERLYVQYDDTTWGLVALQPSLHAGTGWHPLPALHLALGASAALRQPNQSESGTLGLFYKAEGAAAWVF